MVFCSVPRIMGAPTRKAISDTLRAGRCVEKERARGCFRVATNHIERTALTNTIVTGRLNSGIISYAPLSGKQSRRDLHLQEYQSKELLRSNGLNIQRGDVASTADKAYLVAKDLKRTGAEKLVLKCQVLAGGRGKGKLTSGLQGGVKICKDEDEVLSYSKQMLGYRLITHQTDSSGEPVKEVLILESVDIAKELYLAILLDRNYNGPTIICSQMGGMDIEEVAKKNPEAVKVFPINVAEGITPQLAKKVAETLGFTKTSSINKISEQIKNLYSLFTRYDVTQLEINPLAIIKSKKTADDDEVMFIDAKIEFDDSAAYRQRDLFAMEDRDRLDQREVAAQKADLNFVSMDGNIGCLVNGAGLAMATMDIIKLYGGSPANFLDVGGGSDVKQMTEGLRLIQEDPNVKALLVNAFGGIMRCDYVAQAIVQAAKTIDMKIPLVVRLQGNNNEIGRDILERSGLKLKVINDFEEAAKTVCQLARA